MSVKQNTLKGEFSLKGKGLHTGKEVCATFKPAAENTGYKIVRVDLDARPPRSMRGTAVPSGPWAAA